VEHAQPLDVLVQPALGGLKLDQTLFALLQGIKKQNDKDTGEDNGRGLKKSLSGSCRNEKSAGEKGESYQNQNAYARACASIAAA